MGRFRDLMQDSDVEEVQGFWDPGFDDPYLLEHEGIIQETDQAVLLHVDDEEIWIPKSQLYWADPNNAEISPWIAEQKGLM